MIRNSSDIKPFYIYTCNNKLYIKNINENTEKLSNNIFAYCANIDKNQRIHICSIDSFGRLIHFFNNKYGAWKKNIICKAFNNIKNIKDMRLYIINNYLNIFIVEDSSINEDIYRVTHFNFTPECYKVYSHNISNIIKDNKHIYKLNIDELSNIVFEYKTSHGFNRGEPINKTIIFNSKSRIWLKANTLFRNVNCNDYNNTNNIYDDIFEYCYSIVYKLY